MTQTAIPYHFMRGGTSRGPYFLRGDLPDDQDLLAEVLIAAVGAGHPLNIDGLGGGAAVTTKVAMLSVSDHPDADVDYFFAQVSVEDRLVDFKPTCGNILVGVGPAAIEKGLVAANDGETRVRIRAVNTGARVNAIVQTLGGHVVYDGETAVDGVPGTAAPIALEFMDTVGGVTGELFPTGKRTDTMDGIDVTCMDVAMPMVIARASDFGLSGSETVAELDENRDFMARLERVRLEAGRLMGMGDVSKSVTPKFGLLAPPNDGGAATVRYFMPWKCHPTLAVTGSQCMSACLLAPGTVAEGLLPKPNTSRVSLDLEHPAGKMNVVMQIESDGVSFDVVSAGLVRTARKIAQGEVFVPRGVWAGNS